MLAIQYRIKTQKTRDSQWTDWSQWQYLKLESSWTGIDVYSFALEYRVMNYEPDKPDFVFHDTTD